MKTVASVDIGSDKIVALIGEVDPYGDIHIIGVGQSKARGVDKGSITRLEVAARAISTAVREAEEMSGHKVEEVAINVSGASIKSQNEKETVPIHPSPMEVQEEHVNRLLEMSISKAKEEGFDIVHIIPRKYTLDDQEGVEHPIGLVGSKLSAQIHIVKVSATLSKNLEKTVQTAGFVPSQKVASALASARAVLKDEEMEDGVLLIDMGAGLTDFVLYLEGQPIMTGCIPLAGNAITKDISYFMKVDQDEAERLKREHGVALVDLVKEDEILKIKPRGETREISVEKFRLVEVIQVRLEEIIEKVVKAIEDAGFKLDSANAGIVITGGCANLKGIKEFLERFTDLPARVGVPQGIIGLKEKIEDPSFSTAVGLLKFAASAEGATFEKGAVAVNHNSSKGLKGLIKRIKNFFAELI